MSPDRNKKPENDGLLKTYLLRYRYPIYVSVHVVMFSISLAICYLLFFDLTKADYSELGAWFLEGDFLKYLPLFVILKVIIFDRLRLMSGGWKYSGIRDISRILLASWLFVVIVSVAIFLFYALPQILGRQEIPLIGRYFSSFPKRIFLLDFIITVFFVSAARLGYRIYCEEIRPISSEGAKRVLIIGAGDAAEGIIREIRRMPVERFIVVGMADDDPLKQKLVIHSVPVLGTTEDIRDLCKEYDIEELLIAMPSASQKQLRRVIELCRGTQLKFQSLPGVRDLIDGKVTVSQIRPVDINDLLGRESIELDTDSIAKFLEGRTIIVTGAGGSIGSEMCRQICRYRPRQLVLVEQAETPLFEISGELSRTYPEIPRFECICDIYDRERVMSVWDTFRPEVVIHAAAHKHVPMMERNPCEAIKNNIIGTRNVADASLKYMAGEFVNISTDKAVNPSSIMGCSKRIAEIYIQSLNNLDHCKTQFKAVRFGNVLDSNGSVIPIFRRQIAEGGPVTVTHKDMTRYFMTISEASQLVLQAAAIGEGGQIFILDMGEPIKIVDLARDMITLSGFRPDEDIDIEFVGVRPGEKLFEELRTDSELVEPTVHPKVMVWGSSPYPFNEIEKGVDNLYDMTEETNHSAVVAAFREIVPEYRPMNQPEK